MTYKRPQILQVLIDRLRAIRTTNGFETDAGLYLYWGPVVLGPDDPKIGIAVVPGTTETLPEQGGRKVITLPVEFHALAASETPQFGTTENAWVNADLILGDIKRAIELDEPENRILGGLASDMVAGEVVPLPRLEGSTTIGLSAEYRVTYAEVWGAPQR